MPLTRENVISGINSDNSTTTILTANSIYTGITQNVINYSSIMICILSDQDSANSGVNLQFSQDGLNWDINITDTYLTTNSIYSKCFPIKALYFRIKYTNGSVDQTTFRLQTILHKNITHNNNIIKVDFDNGAKDAFHRLRVSNPNALFDINHIYDKNSLKMDENIIGGGSSTYNNNHSSVDMVVSSNGDKITRQSHRYLVYQPGNTILIIMTGVLNSGNANQTNVESRLGYFDDDNGFYFYYDGTNIGVCKRSKVTGSVVNTKITSSNWNNDKMDGNGTSGITLYASKIQMFIIDIEWLGSGEVKMGFMINDNIYYVHKFYHSNQIETTYMTRATLPVRYEIEASGSNASGTMKEICATVISEGGYNPYGHPFTIGNTSVVDIDTTDERPLVVIRLKGNSIRNTLKLSSINVLNTNKGNTIYRFRIYRDIDTMTDLFTSDISFTSVNTNSFTEYNLAPSFSGSNVNIQPNTCVIEGYTTSAQGSLIVNISDNIYLSSNISGTQDLGILTAIGIISSNENIVGNISWIEYT